MVLPHPPFVLAGKQAIEAVAHTPRWSDVAFSKAQIACPQAGNIVVACCVRAAKDDEPYEAEGTSTYRRLESEVWHFIQDQQTPPLAKTGTVEIRG
ncbi:hypothetical protein ACRAWG_30895 [Methylobacterium sp. P31]